MASQTAWQGIFTHGHLEKGQTILIHGGAGVGAYAVQLASHAGATVIATARGDDEAYLNSIGASRVIDYRRPYRLSLAEPSRTAPLCSIGPRSGALIERMSAEDFRAFFIQGADGLMHLRCGFPHLAYSFADEQQILGIDVAYLYEGTCLLGTPAGVRLVHQSALAVHKVA
jgi:hypothetical protein